jgi:hypothetical protein
LTRVVSRLMTKAAKSSATRTSGFDRTGVIVED